MYFFTHLLLNTLSIQNECITHPLKWNFLQIPFHKETSCKITNIELTPCIITPEQSWVRAPNWKILYCQIALPHPAAGTQTKFVALVFRHYAFSFQRSDPACFFTSPIIIMFFRSLKYMELSKFYMTSCIKGALFLTMSLKVRVKL